MPAKVLRTFTDPPPPQCGQAANDRPDCYQKMERGLPSGTLLVRAPRPAAAHNGHAEGDHGQARMLAQGRVYFTRKAD